MTSSASDSQHYQWTYYDQFKAQFNSLIQSVISVWRVWVLLCEMDNEFIEEEPENQDDRITTHWWMYNSRFIINN